MMLPCILNGSSCDVDLFLFFQQEKELIEENLRRRCRHRRSVFNLGEENGRIVL